MTKSTEIALVLSATDKASKVVNAMTGNAQQKLSGLQKLGRSMDDFAPKAMVVGDAITGFFKDATKEAQYAKVHYDGLVKTLENVGDKRDAIANRKLADQFADEADAIEKRTGIEAESIMKGQEAMAAFRNVMSQKARDAGIFNKAIALSTDYAAQKNLDATAAANNLGLALEKPEKAAKKLKAMNIVLTDSEQKKIEALVKSGKTLEAQKVILGQVERVYGGYAERVADPAKVLDANIGDIKEKIGNALLPAVNDAAKAFGDLMKPIGAFIEKHPGAVKAIAGIGLALLTIGKAFTIINALSKASPVMLAIMGLATAAILIIENWGAIKDFFKGLWDNVKKIFTSTWNWIKNMFLNYTPVGLVFKHWDKVKSFFSGLWDGVKNGVKLGWEIIKAIFFDYTPPVLIYKHWDKISAFFSGMWDNVKNVFSGWIDWVFGIGTRMLDAGRNIVTSIWNGISEKAQWLFDKVKGIAKGIRDFFPFSPAKTGPLQDIHKIKLVETIAQSINAEPLLSSISNVADKVRNFTANKATNSMFLFKNSATPEYATVASHNNSQITFAPVIHLNGSATNQDADLISNRMKKEFALMIRDYEAQKERRRLA